MKASFVLKTVLYNYLDINLLCSHWQYFVQFLQLKFSYQMQSFRKVLYLAPKLVKHITIHNDNTVLGLC